MDFNPAIDQCAEVGPVSEIAGTAVDLVNDDAARVSTREGGQHLAELRATLLGSRLLLFEPTGDRESLPLGERLDRRALLL